MKFGILKAKVDTSRTTFWTTFEKFRCPHPKRRRLRSDKRVALRYFISKDLDDAAEPRGRGSGGIVAVYQRYDHEPERRAAFESYERFLRAVLDGTGGDNVVPLAGARNSG
ncbi:MAG: hypothetical protein CR217_08720 [Beijerinckiaceae bacterium]|nr:MAG: hypothetical protein CR217_08720 [Beijerinckiaceae bacterium]